MNKLHPAHLAFALAAAFTLSGCELYFGGNGGDDGGRGSDRWSYCGNDGYYTCQGDTCTLTSPTCPGDPNYSCTSNTDCAAGCYCASSGVCEEAGFCTTDKDCAQGFHCDTSRQSCVPTTCSADTDCMSGEYCDATSGGCTSSCTCTDDASAQSQGWAYCDESRNTCMPANPAGSCGGTVTCTTAAPACGEHQVPQILNGCYTGACEDISACDVTPGCSSLSHEDDCLARNGTCSAVYTGINCTKPDGSACHTGDSGCTCADFRFNSCTDGGSARVLVDGGSVDMSTMRSR